MKHTHKPTVGYIPICHESEIPNELDYRTATIADQNIIMVKGKERTHAFKHDYSLSVSGTLDGSPEEVFARCEELHCEVKCGGMLWVTLEGNKEDAHI